MDSKTLKREMDEAIVESKKLIKLMKEKIHTAKHDGCFDEETMKELEMIHNQWTAKALRFYESYEAYKESKN